MVGDLNKLIDYSYSLDEKSAQNTIQLKLMSYDLKGQFKTIRPLTIHDLNFCDESAAQYTRIKFARNFRTKCRLNVKRLIGYAESKLFIDLYMQYLENNVTLMRTVPILIRQAFAYNSDDVREKWQLVKRFFLVDIFTALNETYRPKMFSDSDGVQRYRAIRYVESVELRFGVVDDRSLYGNKMTTPLLILGYGEVDITRQVNVIDVDAQDLYVDFSFRVVFQNQYKFGSALEVGGEFCIKSMRF